MIRVIKFPSIVQQKVESQLKKWELKIEDPGSSEEVLNRVNFFKLNKVLSFNKKKYLLKILLNEFNMDIVKEEGSQYNLTLLDRSEEKKALSKDVLEYLSEQGSIFEKRDQEIEDNTSSVIESVSSEETETEETKESVEVESDAEKVEA